MTAPTPRDTGSALDPRAVEAAAWAIYTRGAGESVAKHLAQKALTAAAPFLRAEGAAAERQRIFAGIEALPYPDTLEGRFVVDWQEGFDHAQAAAARIAEADPGTTAPTEAFPRYVCGDCGYVWPRDIIGPPLGAERCNKCGGAMTQVPHAPSAAECRDCRAYPTRGCAAHYTTPTEGDDRD